MKNLFNTARAYWAGLAPHIQKTVAIVIAFVLFACVMSVASAQTAPNYTSTFQTGHTGFWFDEDASGSGLAITVDENGLLAAAVYTFSPTTIPVLLPGLQAGDPIEAANHVYLVGASPTSVGQYSVSVPLYLPIFGEGFMLPAGDVVEFGKLDLEVFTCNRIDYRVAIWSGFLSNQPGVVQTVAEGTLRQLTRGGGTCALDCTSPDFGPFPASCPKR